MSRYKEMYKNEIVEAMTKKFGYKNVMEVPKREDCSEHGVARPRRTPSCWIPQWLIWSGSPARRPL